MGKEAASVARDTFTEVGDQASAVKVTAQHPLTTVTETDMVLQAFGPTPTSVDSATARDSEDTDTAQVSEDMANGSPPDTADMAMATTALAPLVVATEPVWLVLDKAAARGR